MLTNNKPKEDKLENRLIAALEARVSQDDRIREEKEDEREAKMHLIYKKVVTESQKLMETTYNNTCNSMSLFCCDVFALHLNIKDQHKKYH